MLNKALFTSRSDEWETPQWLFDKLNNRFEFALDVCETEPLPADSPLWDAPHLILTPHRAGASQHRPRKTFEFFRDNLERYLRGQPVVNVVDKRKGY
ncbi:MAG: NAD(P)-dependent oxidoreductase [Mariprofundaceae bacterium]